MLKQQRILIFNYELGTSVPKLQLEVTSNSPFSQSWNDAHFRERFLLREFRENYNSDIVVHLNIANKKGPNVISNLLDFCGHQLSSYLSLLMCLYHIFCSLVISLIKCKYLYVPGHKIYTIQRMQFYIQWFLTSRNHFRLSVHQLLKSSQNAWTTFVRYKKQWEHFNLDNQK